MKKFLIKISLVFIGLFFSTLTVEAISFSQSSVSPNNFEQGQVSQIILSGTFTGSDYQGGCTPNVDQVPLDSHPMNLVNINYGILDTGISGAISEGSGWLPSELGQDMLCDGFAQYIPHTYRFINFPIPVTGLSPGTYQVNLNGTETVEHFFHRETGSQFINRNFSQSPSNLTFTINAPSVATINVSSNQSTGWTITGPSNFGPNYGTTASYSGPGGTYTIYPDTLNCYSSPAVSPSTSQTVAAGSEITFTLTYTYTCGGGGGTPPPPPPPLGYPSVDLTFNNSQGPIDNFTSGSSGTLSWTVSGADSCTATGGTSSWNTPSAKSAGGGSQSSGPIYSSTTFYISCSNSTGATSDGVAVNIADQPPEICTDTGATNYGGPAPCTYAGGATSCTVSANPTETESFPLNNVDVTVAIPSWDGNAHLIHVDCTNDAGYNPTACYQSGWEGCEGVTSSAPKTFPDLCNYSSPATLRAYVRNLATQGDASCTLPIGYPDKTLTTSISVGAGTITGTGINCPGDCSQSYAHGTNVSLTATPATGYSFTGWSGACSDSVSCTLSMTQARSVSASFSANSHSLSVSKNGSGSGTITSSPSGINCGSDCSESYGYGTSVTLTATPSAGSSLSSWSGCSTTSGNSCTVSMTQARSVTATFNGNSYTLTVSKAGSGSGTVSSSPNGINCGGDCSENYNYNTQVTLTANSTGQSSFANWSGACSGNGQCVLTMTQAQSVTATFNAQNTYTISGYVYRDLNTTSCCSGVRDANETAGFSGRTVELRTTSGTLVASTNTVDGTGYYQFSGIAGTAYRISHAVPSGYVRTTDDDTNINVNSNTNYNFGLYLTPPPFDYSLSNSGNVAVTKGSGDVYEQNTVTKSLTSGAAQSVTLTLSGVPSGVTYSISNSSCSPTCNSTITFTITPTATIGTHQITVTGSPLSKTTSFNLTITGSPFSVSCSPSSPTMLIGQNVTWTASASGGQSPYTYLWSGSNIPTSPAPATNPYVKSYSTIGTKMAVATVTDSDGVQSACPPASVQIYFNPDFEEF